MKKLSKTVSAIAFSAFALTLSSSAFADCNDMGSNEWNNLSNQMAQAYDKGQLDEALAYGKQLMLICNRSPIVNFTMSEIYRKQDNELESYNYAKRATENIQDYPVPIILAERMWMRRAETDLPYKRQVKDLQDKIDAIQADESSCANTKLQYDALVAKTREEDIRSEYLMKETQGNWRGAMWSGVGIMGAGLALTIAGSVLVTTVDKVEAKGSASTDYSGFSITKKYVTGWTILGAGIVATAGGAVLTGIAGYRYTHLDLNNDGKKDESISLSVMPTSASFSMTF